MIKLHDLTKRFGDKCVIDRLTLTLPQSGIVALMGPSGCGKTTLLRLLAGLEVPNEGEITRDYRRVAVAFQEPRLIPWLSCRENVRFVLDAPRDVDEILEALELKIAAEQLPSALSGGMKQRVSLARALAFGGDLLLLDEPFSALDAALKVRIAPLIKTANPTGLTVVISHDEKDAELLGAQILHLAGSPVNAIVF